MCEPCASEKSPRDWPHHGAFHGGDCGCGCRCGGGHFSRRFISREEKRAMLEVYQEQLEKELTGLKEHISELEGH